MYHYKECGLDFVHLANGYEVHETEYGRGVSITAADSLDREIARTIVLSDIRLNGMCVRFLRSQLDFSQKELADALGAQRLTVLRWESKPGTPVPGAADRSLRAYFTNRMLGSETLVRVVDNFDAISGSDNHYIEMRCVDCRHSANENVTEEDGDWHGRVASR